MHDGNYNKNDPRCVMYADLIEGLEKKRIRFQTKPDSKLYSKDGELFDAIDDIYDFLRVTTGYAPAWLINGLYSLSGKHGRPKTYSHDDRILYSQFVNMLVRKGCSQNQSINLLGVLKGMTVITEGFKKEVRETYKEYLGDKTEEKAKGFIGMGEIISYMGQRFTDPPHNAPKDAPFPHEFSLALVENTNEKIEKTVVCLRDICGELIGYMKDNRKLVETRDVSHSEQHSEVIKMMDHGYNDPLCYFFKENPERNNDFYVYCHQLRDYLHTINYFLKREKDQKRA